MSHDIESLVNSVTANYIYANRLNIESNLTTDSLYSQTLKKSAITYYKQSIKLFPYYADFHYKIASIYQNNFNDIVNAEKYYRNCLKIDSANFAANYSLGLINFNKKNFTNSNSYFSKAYQKIPTDSLTLFYFAQSADAIGNLELSYRLNKELLDLYPTLTYPYMNLGVYYSKKLKDDTAVVYFEKAIELGERNPQLLNQLDIYYKGKNNQQKVNYFLGLLQRK
jgi:tetratricopeptide (TPR) repeat protein